MGRKHGRAKSSFPRYHFRSVGYGSGTDSEGEVKYCRWSNTAVARFLDMPRRIAQERVPTASNVGSRDVTWVIDSLPDLLQ